MISLSMIVWPPGTGVKHSLLTSFRRLVLELVELPVEMLKRFESFDAMLGL